MFDVDSEDCSKSEIGTCCVFNVRSNHHGHCEFRDFVMASLTLILFSGEPRQSEAIHARTYGEACLRTIEVGT